jgi:hypothetical protein
VNEEPAELDGEDIAVILNQADDFTRWLSDVKDYALSKALSGVKFPGYKLVEGRSNRRYTDEEAVAEAATTAGYTDIYETKLIGLTAMEKLLGKAKFKKVLGELIEKPQGKPVLVPEADKFAYSVDGGEVQVVDLLSDEEIPAEVLDALTDDAVTKWAYNANFERVRLSHHLRDRGISLDPFADNHFSSDYLGLAQYLNPESWRCSILKRRMASRFSWRTGSNTTWRGYRSGSMSRKGRLFLITGRGGSHLCGFAAGQRARPFA